MSVPFFVVRVRLEETMPAMVTGWSSEKRCGPFSSAKSEIMAPMLTAPAFLAASRYSSMGWPER